MKTLTVEQLESNFEDIFSRVEKGEKFIIQSNTGNVMLVPYNQRQEEVDDLIRIHTDHEEGC